MSETKTPTTKAEYCHGTMDAPHRTLELYYEAMTKGTPKWLKPIERLLTYGSHRRDWTSGGAHESWMTCDADHKNQCRGYHALVRGDGKLLTVPHCSGVRQLYPGQHHHQAIVINGYLHGVADIGFIYNNPQVPMTE